MGANGEEGTLGADGNFQKRDRGRGSRLYTFMKNHQTVPLQRVDTMMYKLYLNKIALYLN